MLCYEKLYKGADSCAAVSNRDRTVLIYVPSLRKEA